MIKDEISLAHEGTDVQQNGSSKVRSELAYERYRELIRNNGTADKEQTVILSKFGIRARRLVGMLLLSPFFLFSSLSVMLFMPVELIKNIAGPLSSLQFWEIAGKRFFDILFSVVGFVVCSIFFFIIPIFIKMDSKGPVFYKQIRAGKNNRKKDRRVVSLEISNERRKEDRRQVDLFGRPFWVYKFRTMGNDAEKKSGAVWAQKNDPRITTIGNILRFTHVDEIPQFINVLHGEMSLVGPRPERPELMPELISHYPEFANRLKVKPGMTGIAQIVCGYDVSIEGVKDKLKCDMEYVKRSSLKEDISILFQTLWVIVRGKEVLQ